MSCQCYDRTDVTDPARYRLYSQQIVESRFKRPKDLVGWMGAMQAQDFAMVKWGIGVRLPNVSETEIERAIDKGEIIRTHLLRPTWHCVSADDIYWMLELTAPKIKASMKSRHRELELDHAVIAKSKKIIEKALGRTKCLIREDLIAECEKGLIPTDNNRASHLLMLAELDGLVCSGELKGRKQTYALLEDRVPKTQSLSRHEALARLATKYFTSHGPASLRDFVWWSGLSVVDAKLALEAVKPAFLSETVGSQTYWFADSKCVSVSSREEVHLLPAFDEFIISYTDRSSSLRNMDHAKAIFNNGIFRPVVIVNGRVEGTWKRTLEKGRVVIRLEPFDRPSKQRLRMIQEASERYGTFLEKEIELVPKSC